MDIVKILVFESIMEIDPISWDKNILCKIMALSVNFCLLSKGYLVVCSKANAHKADYSMICVGPFYQFCKLVFAYFIYNHILDNSVCGLKLHVMMCCLC